MCDNAQSSQYSWKSLFESIMLSIIYYSFWVELPTTDIKHPKGISSHAHTYT